MLSSGPKPLVSILAVIALADLFCTTASAQTGQGAGAESVPLLEEVIVTAQKRIERVQDVPVSISVLGADEIERRGLVSFQDYLRTVPGVTEAPLVTGTNTITFRGLSPGFFSGDATVGVYFGEIPVTGVGRNDTSIDMKLVDMARVEILRGPQGTLYGANSLGGTIRDIPAPPDLKNFTVEGEAGYSQTARYGGENDKLTGVLNVPLLADRLALRLVAYKIDNSGYVRNIAGTDPAAQQSAQVYGASAVNAANQGAQEYRGARASLMWKPTEQLDVSLLYAWQDLYQDGSPYSNLNLNGDYLQSYVGIGSVSRDGRHFYRDKNNLGNLVVNYDFGPVSVLASSSVVSGGWAIAEDVQLLYGPTTPAAIYNHPDRRYVSQEIRMTSKFDGPLQFLAGFFHQDAREGINYQVRWTGTAAQFPGPVFGISDPSQTLIGFTQESNIKQHAFFGELSYKFLRNLELTLGERHFTYTRVLTSGDSFSGSVPIQTSDSGNTGKVNLAYKPSSAATFYAQWSQGFRLGSPLQQPSAFFLATCDANGDGLLDGTNTPYRGNIKSDTTDNYEIGEKLAFMGGRLSLNAAAYYVNWKNLPITVQGLSPQCSATRNAGAATSKGVEAEADLNLGGGWRVDLSASYNNAMLSRDAPTLGNKGDPLPFAANLNARFGLTYAFKVAGYDSFVAGDFSYQSGYYATLARDTPEMGDYGSLGLRAGVELDRVALEFYGNNLTNRDSLEYAALDPTIVVRMQPRVVGVNIKYKM